MKKIAVSILAMVSAFALAACAGGEAPDGAGPGGASSAEKEVSGGGASGSSVEVSVGGVSGGSGEASGGGKQDSASGSASGGSPEKADSSGGARQFAAVLGRDTWDISVYGRGVQLVGDTVYYPKYETQEDTGREQLAFYRRRADGPEELVYTYAGPEGTEAILQDACVDTEGNWYTLCSETDPDGSGFYLEKRDSSGQEIYREQPDGFRGALAAESLLECAVDGEGNFYAVTFEGTLFLWDGQGAEVRTLPLWQGNPSYQGEKGLANAGDAGVYAYWQDGASSLSFRRLRASEGAGRTFSLQLPLSGRRLSGQDGLIQGKERQGTAAIRVIGDYEGGIWLADGQGLWHVEMGEEEPASPVYLFGWEEVYVNVQPDAVWLVSSPEEGRYLLFCTEIMEEGAQLVLAGLVAEDELPRKQAVTLGCRNTEVVLDNIEEIVRAYNNWSDKYVLEVKAYGQSDGHGVTGAFSALTAELLKGEGPDLFEADLIPVETYAGQGILEDLRPYLAKRQGGGLVEQVESALEIDGGLYTLADSFAIGALEVRAGYAGNGGLSVAQCARLASDFPDVCMVQYASASSMFDLMTQADWDSYVDREGKKCFFDSQEFISLLESVKSWKEGTGGGGGYYGTEAIAKGECLMNSTVVTSMSRYLDLKKECGDFAEITGYPNQAGEPRYLLRTSKQFGINSASPNKEGAWDFMEYLLSDGVQEELERKCDLAGSFPITEEYFTKSLQRGGLPQMFETEKPTPTPEDVEAVRAMLDGLYSGRNWQKEIGDIVDEETEAVFSGNKTAADVAKIIQNRVQLFLEEQ